MTTVVGRDIESEDLVALPRSDMPCHLVGAPGCLHPLTPIYDPVTGTSATVGERFTLGEPFHVVAMGEAGSPVVAWAAAP